MARKKKQTKEIVYGDSREYTVQKGVQNIDRVYMDIMPASVTGIISYCDSTTYSNVLEEIRKKLNAEGLDYPDIESVQKLFTGTDGNLTVTIGNIGPYNNNYINYTKWNDLGGIGQFSEKNHIPNSAGDYAALTEMNLPFIEGLLYDLKSGLILISLPTEHNYKFNIIKPDTYDPYLLSTWKPVLVSISD